MADERRRLIRRIKAGDLHAAQQLAEELEQSGARGDAPDPVWAEFVDNELCDDDGPTDRVTCGPIARLWMDATYLYVQHGDQDPAEADYTPLARLGGRGYGAEWLFTELAGAHARPQRHVVWSDLSVSTYRPTDSGDRIKIDRLQSPGPTAEPGHRTISELMVGENVTELLARATASAPETDSLHVAAAKAIMRVLERRAPPQPMWIRFRDAMSRLTKVVFGPFPVVDISADDGTMSVDVWDHPWPHDERVPVLAERVASGWRLGELAARQDVERFGVSRIAEVSTVPPSQGEIVVGSDVDGCLRRRRELRGDVSFTS